MTSLPQGIRPNYQIGVVLKGRDFLHTWCVMTSSFFLSSTTSFNQFLWKKSQKLYH